MAVRVIELSYEHPVSATLAQACHAALRPRPGYWEARIEPAVVGQAWFVSICEMGCETPITVRIRGDVETPDEVVAAVNDALELVGERQDAAQAWAPAGA